MLLLRILILVASGWFVFPFFTSIPLWFQLLSPFDIILNIASLTFWIGFFIALITSIVKDITVVSKPRKYLIGRERELEEQKNKYKNSHSSVKPKYSNEPKLNKIPDDFKPPANQQSSASQEFYLISLLNGDRQGADRLISSTQLRYPDKDKLWCVQKVIDDIVRDRR